MKISWISKEHFPTKGEFGLTFSPGSTPKTSTAKDLDFLTQESVSHIICLQQEFELDYNEPPETMRQRRKAVESRGMQFTHSPIEDMEAPSLKQIQALVEIILQQLDAGKKIIVHCYLGLGRAGTIAACTLLSKGYSPKGAIAMIRYCRPGAIQSESQEKLIHQFSKQ